MANLETDHVFAKRPGPWLPIFAAVIIPLGLVIWLSIGTHNSVIDPPSPSIFLIAFLTQIGVGIIYTGEWAAYRISTSKRPFSIIGLEVSPVLACIAIALGAPAAIFTLGALL